MVESAQDGGEVVLRMPSVKAGARPPSVSANAGAGFSPEPSASRRRPPPSGTGAAETGAYSLMRSWLPRAGRRRWAAAALRIRNPRPGRPGRTFRHRPRCAPRCRRRGGRTGLRILPGSTGGQGRGPRPAAPRDRARRHGGPPRPGRPHRAAVPGRAGIRGRPGVRPGVAPAAVHIARCRPRGSAARFARPAARRVAVAARLHLRAGSQRWGRPLAGASDGGTMLSEGERRNCCGRWASSHPPRSTPRRGHHRSWLAAARQTDRAGISQG